MSILIDKSKVQVDDFLVEVYIMCIPKEGDPVPRIVELTLLQFVGFDDFITDKDHVVTRLGTLHFTPYRGGGFSGVHYVSHSGVYRHYATEERIMGVIPGGIDHLDTYTVKQYLRRVAKGYHSYLYDLSMKKWYDRYCETEDQ
jgi:hypothetical protein